MPILIKHAPHLCDCEALTLALRGHVELRELGLSDVTVLSGQEEVLWAGPAFLLPRFSHSRPYGCIVFEQDPEELMIFTKLVHVEREYREQGIFRQLWHNLLVLARERGVRRIENGVSAQNKVMQQAVLKLGQQLSHHIYTTYLEV